MTETISVALVGLGGYGNRYLGMLVPRDLDGIRLVAGVDPAPDSCTFLQELEQAGIPIFPDLDAFYREMSADLVIVSTPIHHHAPMTCRALAAGSHVLCEKPLAATMQDAQSMRDAEQKSQRQVAVGFQWSFSAAIIRLKRDILAGRFGKAVRLKTICLSPRNASYYARAPWAGKIKLGDRWVMDSPVSNATAHYLHNMLYLLGPEEHLSAVPATVAAETYRAKPIENFDTAMLRCITEREEEILFYATHSSCDFGGPISLFEFEQGTVSYPGGDGELVARFADDTTESYGSPTDVSSSKIVLTVEAIRNGTRSRCGIEAASSHLAVVNAIQKSHEEIPVFPESLIQSVDAGDSDSLACVKGLDEVMTQCYDAGLLPAELGGIPWARSAPD